jgi:hypothetical protein
MQEKIVVHGNPNSSVFGLLGNDVSTDEGKLYVKVDGDSKNIGWIEIPPTPTPTQTVSITPSKTPIVTRQIFITPTPSLTNSPTVTPTVTTSRPLITPTPTNTPFKTQVIYTIASTPGGQASRIDGPTPTGIISIGSGEMILQAIPDAGYHFAGWDAPEGISFNISKYSLNPIVSGFNVGENVTITANFGVGLLPTYYINGVTGGRGTDGRISFYYINSIGEEIEYYEEGFPVGATLTNITCGSRITRVDVGTAYLTSNPC